MHTSKYQHGRYIVAPDIDTPEAVVRWITSGAFETFEKEALRFGRRGRPRNRIYSFHLPDIGRQVVMKVFFINPQYKTSRKIHLFFNHYFKDYNKIAFKGCCALRQAGFAAAKPLAYWTLRRGFLNPKSYFLYEKVEIDNSIQDLFDNIQAQENDMPELLNAIKRKAAATLKKIHDAGLRHGDFHMRNILIDTRTDAVDQLSPNDIEKATFHFIDYDCCHKARFHIPLIKKIFDLKDFQRLAIAQTDAHEMLDLYLGRHTTLWHGVLNFWKRGGLNPLHWLKWLRQNRPRKHKRHLRE